jgi:threonine dehydratase
MENQKHATAIWAEWSDEQLLKNLAAETEAACGRIYKLDQPTQVDSVELANCDLLLKREDLSKVHSYKWRGAFNKIKSLHDSGFGGTMVAASAGNHAQGVAISAADMKLKATVFMPRSTPLLKQQSVKQLGGAFVEIRLCGDSFEEAAQHATEFAVQSGGLVIPPYDDLHVVAGQSTIAVEIAEAGLEPTHAFLPIGGGGMASGVASVLRARFPKIKLIGVEAENQNSMGSSIQNGARKKIEWLDRFCDGTAVAIPGALNFRLCKLLLDDCITVSNDQVCEAIQFLWQKLRVVVEPSAGIGVAAALQAKLSKQDRPLTILSGSNVDFMMLPKIAKRGQAQRPETRYYAFEIGERPGALSSLLDRFFGTMNIIDFQYGQVERDRAYPVIGIEVPYSAIDQLNDFLAAPGIPQHAEVTGTAAADFRVIPFNVDLLKLPFFAVIEFANRPGALREFMRFASEYAGVCYMNYTDTGQTEGQALMGFDFENIARQTEFFGWLDESQTKFEKVDIEVIRHFTGSTDSPRTWKDIASSLIRSPSKPANDP